VSLADMPCDIYALCLLACWAIGVQEARRELDEKFLREMRTIRYTRPVRL
jgi:hypothetical protein